MNQYSEIGTLGLSGYNPVVIEKVHPHPEQTQFAVKVIEGDLFTIQADIFSHGSYCLAARVLYRHAEDKNWQQAFMTHRGNDRWEGQFTVEKAGTYSYFIRAWIDPAATWQKEVSSRIHRYMAMEDMLPGGKMLLEIMMKKASAEDKVLMKEAIRMFADKDRAEEAGQFAISYRFTEWLNRYPDTTSASETKVFRLFAYAKKLEFSAWYTMFPRSASHEAGKHGTFEDVVRLLPRIAGMGFDVLHFPPVHPIGEKKRKGKNSTKKAQSNDPGSPYAIGNAEGGHEAFHPELGTPEDFQYLVTEAKNLGIDIALDLALQFAPDHPWVSAHPDWFEKPGPDSSEPVISVYSEQRDFLNLQINAQNWEAIKSAVLEILEIWIGRGVNIIRIIQPDVHPFGWWQEIIHETILHHPETIFCAGTVTRPKIMHYLAKSGFGLSESYFMWRNAGYELQQYCNELAYAEQKDFFRTIFRVNSPDVNPFNLQSGHEPQQLIRFFLAATLSGCYGIYGPVFELLVYEAFPGKEKYWNSEHYEISYWDWEKENKITYLISAVNKIRRENQALQHMRQIHMCAVQNDQILAYYKGHENGNRMLCVVNLNAHQRQAGIVQVPLHLINKNHDEIFIAHDLITDARYQWKGEWNYVELDPHILPFHLLRIEDYYGEYH